MIFVNGEYVHASESAVLATDRGFLFGDGVFTTLRVAHRQIEFFEQHCERFSLHCRKMHISPPVIELGHILKLIELNNAQEGIWRLKIIATAKKRLGSQSEMREIGAYVILLEQHACASKGSCALWLYPEPVASPLSKLKTLGCASRFYILDEAMRQGYDDALLMCSEGFMTETTFANFFWRIGNDLFTPSATLPLMSGLALTFIKQAVNWMGYNWHEVRINAKEIPSTAQLFICNSMKGIVPVVSLNQYEFTRDHVFEDELQEKLAQIKKAYSKMF